MIRVQLPGHLRTLAGISGEIEIEVAVDGEGAITPVRVLDELEERYPVLRGTIRHHGSGARRAHVRFFACEQDLSHASPNAPLPEAVARGEEPFIVLGAMSGG